MDTLIGTDIAAAAQHLQHDRLVGMPTETVYGLAANAFSENAIRLLYATKRRPVSNPLIVHTSAVDCIKPWVLYLPEAAEALLQHFAPGPLTVLLPKSKRLPDLVNGGRKEVAIRLPAHPVAQALLAATGFPLVAPSANLFGTISPTTPQHVYKNFAGTIPYILDGGACAVGIESTVVGFNDKGNPVIYRQGAISAEAIESVAGRVAGAPQNHQPSPGMLPYHYAPRTPLLLADDADWNESGPTVGALRFAQWHPHLPQAQQAVLSPTASLEEAAHNLYAAMHTLDEKGFEKIYAQRLPDVGLGKVLNERLQKAAYRYAPEVYTQSGRAVYFAEK